MYLRKYISLVLVLLLTSSVVWAQKTGPADKKADTTGNKKANKTRGKTAADKPEDKPADGAAPDTSHPNPATILPHIPDSLTIRLKGLSGENARIKAALQKEQEENQQLSGREWWLTLTAMAVFILDVALVIVVIVTHFKLKKMADDRRLREEMLKKYTDSVTSLYDYLQKKGVSGLMKKGYEEIQLEQKFRSIKGKLEELVDKYIKEDSRNQTVSGELDDLRQQLKTSLQENQHLTEKLKGQVSPTVAGFIPYTRPEDLPPAFIKAEIMLSAGPRKDTGHNDTELGEDVAGILSLPQETFFWLLDGTSDGAALKGGEQDGSHIFSSRLLAQNLSYYIQKNIAGCLQNSIPLECLLQQAQDHVQAEWTQRLNSTSQEKKEGFIRMIRQDKFKPLCSTTVIIGRLMANGHLYALRSGDSKIFPFMLEDGKNPRLAKDFTFAKDPVEDYDRVSFRLDLEEKTDEFLIRSNKVRWLTATAQNIDSLFVFTDGIGRVVEAQLASGNPGIVELIRQNISRIPQKTYDDKTLIILERISNT